MTRVRSLLTCATILAIAAALIFAAKASGIAAEQASGLSSGDQLVYEITVELQQHHSSPAGKSHDRTIESSAQGTETFSIYSIARDGSALANVAASFQGMDAGTPFESHSAMQGKVLSDGGLRVKNQLGLGISDAMNFASATAAELAQRGLAVGGAWTAPQDTQSAKITLSRKVSALVTYQKMSAYEVQSSGSGQLLEASDGHPASGSMAISGTSYYNPKDHLILGQAVRTLTVVQGPGGAHDSYSATMNIVLRSWTHASPAASATAQASPAPSAEATGSTMPAPVYTTPAPVPTVTPRLEP